MKGKIDNAGRLHIWRGDDWKDQHCHTRAQHCSDWCPLFGEPYEQNLLLGNIALNLCIKRTLVFDSLDDQREGEISHD